MRITTAILLCLSFATAGWSQTAITQTVYRESTNIVDNSGNLLVIDSGFTYTATATTATPSGFFPRGARGTPHTRLTLIHSAGSPQSIDFDGNFELLGAGTQAIYAVVTTLTTTTTGTTSVQKLIAIVGNQALPANVSGFPSFAVTAPSNVRLGGADTLSVITHATRATGTTAATPRQAQLVRFNGTFSVLNSGALPQ
ncbi:MAG TPA: hypothetical protein VE422_38970 [Terriglobia bacterium]|nr:hypothetical protein [Terriglobia bacterium]